jgi:predicted phage terminase large subunit-like protein
MIRNSFAKLLKFHDESTLREQIRTNLLDWAADIMNAVGLAPSAHHRVLLQYLSRIANGEIKRLIVLMPPGSAKSTYVSVIFPIWWFIQHPSSSIIAASHTAALVQRFSRRILSLIEENQQRIGFNILPGNRSPSHWCTTTGGEYFATGVRGAITGRRADLIIIDDPIKSMAEADSSHHRQSIWDWYTAELMTRLKPDARIVLIMTRWHEQDLGGQLIARGDEDWQVLRLPAIAEDNDPIGRPLGAPLWPEWENLEALIKKRSVIGSRTWSALFQQSPTPPEDRLFNIRLLKETSLPDPDNAPRVGTVRAWDLAATSLSSQGDPDWTVGLKLTQLKRGGYIIDDIIRLRCDCQRVQDEILNTAKLDGHSVIISLPIDPGQAGKSQISHFSSLLRGYRIHASHERGSKMSRAIPVAVQIEAGNVAIRRGSWYSAFIDELEAFPQGPKDDQVDALSRAFAALSSIPPTNRRVFVPYNVR